MRGPLAVWSRILFGVLVLATVGAFFVAAKIKNTPSIIQSVRHSTLISPNGDGKLDTIGFSLRLSEADRVTLAIVDADGDPVQTILDDRKLGAYTNLQGADVRWDGRDSDGNVVADGLYRVRITLRDQGRSVIDTRSITVDTTPPKPTIVRVDPSDGGGPAVLPRSNGGDVTAVFKRARADASISVFQTSPVVRKVLTEDLEPGTNQWSWDGTVAGARQPAGTYIVVASWRDEAQNLGTSVPLDAQGLPILGKPKLPGKGGITIRYVAVAPPTDPVKAGTQATFGVATLGKEYRWSLRRIGGRTIKSGRADRSPLTVKIPRANAGLYSFGVTTGSHSSQAPFVVNGTTKQGGSPDNPRGVLVIADTMTWQGRNPVDDDGDGSPNLLDYGSSAQMLAAPGRQRPYAGTGLPRGLPTHEAQVFKWLDNDHAYDVATDTQLEADARLLRGYRGVILAGDARWLTDQQRSRLKRFVQDGGTLMSIGTQSLRRTVDYSSRDGKLTNPSKAQPEDLFGATIGPLQAQPTALEIFGDDQIDLFGRTAGSIDAVTGWEQTLKVGSDAEQVAAAVTADTNPPGKTVTVAVKIGDGLVIRPGFDTFSRRLGTDPSIDGLMDGAWALLSR